MSGLVKRFWQSRWRDSVLIAPLLGMSWFTYGWVLSSEIFDKYFEALHLLTTIDSTLSYVAVLFAIQIPVFILLLEKMYNSGYVKRLVLPSIINFREVLISYVILSLLLLISPRTSYLYFPTLGITTLSLYTIIEAVRVMFEARKLKTREDEYIEQLVELVLKNSLQWRIGANKFFETIKNQAYVTHRLIEFGSSDRRSDKHYAIRSPKAGIVSSINVERLNQLMADEYYSDVDSVRNNSISAKDMTTPESRARITLQVRPSATVKKQDEIIRLTLDKDDKTPTKRFMDSLRVCINVSYDHPDSADKQLDDIIKDFKQQLRAAIDKDDTVAVDDALSTYGLLTAGLASLHFNKDSGYNFETARGEFHQMFSDTVSSRLRSIAEVINDEFLHAVRAEHQETVKSLIASMYKNILDVTDSFDILTVARAEQAFTSALAQLIYSDKASFPNMQYREHVLGMLTFRLKEHTSLLLYHQREYNDTFSFTEEELKQWIETRLNDARGFMLGTYKNSQFTMFKDVKGILEVVEDDYDLYRNETASLSLHVQCVFFIIAAYMHGNPKESEEQKRMREMLDRRLCKLSAQDITRIFVETIDKDYADKWRIDTYDLIADGRMHAVPDFKIKLKSLWAKYMLDLDNFPEEVDYYPEVPIAKTSAFSDGLPSSSGAFLTQHLKELADTGKDTVKLQTLVETFISERFKWEDETLANIPLDKEKVSTFRNEVINGYKKSAFALSIFEPANKLNLVTRAPKGFLSYGWNQIDDKYGFVKDWHIGVGHLASEYGNKIARAENKYVLETLLANPRYKVNDFNSWIGKLSRAKSKQWVIISVGVGDWYVRYHREDIAKHIEGGEPTDNKMVFKDINQLGDAHYIYLDTLAKGLYAIPLDSIGTLHIKGSHDTPIRVSIDAYSHDESLLQGIMKDPPEWLAEKRTSEEQKTFLKTKVRVLIQHPFKYEAPKRPVVYFYPIDDKDSD